MADVENKLSSSMDSLHLNGDAGDDSKQDALDEIDEKWGLPKCYVYKIGIKFYKEKEGKAIHVSYKDKLKLMALTKQVKFGKYQPNTSPAVGFLDVVGNDRIKVWQSLGEMDKDNAMEEFTKVLDELCPLFKPYVEAHKREKEEQERKRKEEEERQRKEEEERERQRLEEEAKQRQQQQQQKQINQELQIRAALNQQTSVQFKQYAEQQCPGNTQQQEDLIKQLQEQHFQQYMQQVYQQQLLHQQQQYQQINTNMSQGGPVSQPQTQPPQQPLPLGTVTPALIPTQAGNGGPITPIPIQNGTDNHVMTQQGDTQDEENEDTSELIRKMPPLVPASMWTRKDLRSFKDMVRKSPDNVIKIGSLATATVRVPTHEDGTCLFWEFATDSYDLGFGVYFEWTIAPSNQVSVHVSESSDEEDLEEEEGGGGDLIVRVPTHEDGTCLFWEFATDSYDLGFGVYFEWTIAPSNQVSVHVSESSDEEDLEEEEGGGGGDTPNSKEDIEKGAASKKDDNRPPTDEIIPVYRRDCQEEVYCGSHMYPGRGVYLLKFDNSYSLWRSKTLYYRVYYTR